LVLDAGRITRGLQREERSRLWHGAP
jgi:hypothetical protein